MTSHSHKGVFITLEGVEGCGKSTQAERLVTWFRERGYEVVLTREPGGTPLGERLRDALLDVGGTMLAETELFLYLASRAEHTAEVILPVIERGSVVISDRYADASVAYQGGGRRLGADLVRSLNQVATQGVKPDVTFLMDLDPEEGLTRLDGRASGGTRDRIERETIEFHRRVRDAYLAEAEREPERFVVIDASEDVDRIAAKVTAALEERLTSSGDDN